MGFGHSAAGCGVLPFSAGKGKPKLAKLGHMNPQEGNECGRLILRKGSDQAWDVVPAGLFYEIGLNAESRWVRALLTMLDVPAKAEELVWIDLGEILKKVGNTLEPMGLVAVVVIDVTAVVGALHCELFAKAH